MQIIFDGYNVIHAKNFPGRKRRSLEEQRDYLIHLVRQYAARKRVNCIIVFDSKYPYSRQQKHYQRVQVRFSPAHMEADQIIQEMIRQSKNPQMLLIISSDREIQHTAQIHGARILSSEAFLEEELAPQSFTHPESEIEEDSKPDTPMSEQEIQEWLRLFSEGEENEDTTP